MRPCESRSSGFPASASGERAGDRRDQGGCQSGELGDAHFARIEPCKTGLGKTGVVSGRGIACVDYEGGNGYAALIAEVDVNLETGLVRPTRFVVALDCGPISNPDGLRNQIEGGILQGMSRALVEEVTWDNRRITSTDWETYRSLHLDYEMPAIESVFVTPDGVPAIGAGETAITVTPAAIGNAIFDATGGRLRDLPFTPERVSAALREAGHGSGQGVNMRNASYVLAALLLAFDAAAQTEHAKPAAVTDAAREAGAAAAFEAIVPVLRHPRCMNCHSAGDFPRQGDDSHQHTMQVRRGPDGRRSSSTCRRRWCSGDGIPAKAALPSL